jgi:hypothetical protein
MPRSFIGLALAALAALFSARAPAQDSSVDWIDWDAVENGEVMLQIEMTEGIVTIDLALRIEADSQAIWDVLTACEVTPEYVPNVIACQQIDSIDNGQSELFLQTVKPAFFLPKFEHVFRLDYSPPERIDMHHVSGPMDVLDGSWRLLPRADDSIVLVHTMRVKPGFPVPRFFVRNTLRRDLPGVLREVRARAEGVDK